MFDVGARGGPLFYTVPLQDRVHHVLIEPERREAARLSRKFRDELGITVVDRAVGSVSGQQVLAVTRLPTRASLRSPGSEDKDDVLRRDLVDVQRLDRMSHNLQLRPDVLKIDVQGTEYEVIEGLGDLRPYVVSVEISLLGEYQGQHSATKVFERLNDLGYRRINAPIDNAKVTTEDWALFSRDLSLGEWDKCSVHCYLVAHLIFGELKTGIACLHSGGIEATSSVLGPWQALSQRLANHKQDICHRY